ncbi:cation channel sperm-associated protein subunit delta-like [Peromyscus leucopus]|uniref:cation channel sperm-associated protein subunit delta-like n=1 Tax=Peromyscus leucopus TaxID=10041 RepID=UPI0018857EA0|nr:cation channel sperm-associated protein subunit delta-like [Peromyscus leucopus]
MLFYAFNSTFVLRDFCHSKAVLYLGKKIFISKDNFESSLQPLIIPKSMRARGASVTSALFTSDSKLLLVVNKKVYMYNYLWNRWHKAIGLWSPVPAADLLPHPCHPGPSAVPPAESNPQ